LMQGTEPKFRFGRKQEAPAGPIQETN
jgi:hypothetical protein